MGTIQHHAIVVTGWDESIERAHARASKLFDSRMVSALSEPVTNSFRSFCVFPDGSKEGWAPSNDNDNLRDVFKRFLASDDNVGWIDWIEVSFGELGHSISSEHDD